MHCRLLVQMMSDKGMPDLVSGMTDEWWRLFRKGLAPAFNPASIRFETDHSCVVEICQFRPCGSMP